MRAYHEKQEIKDFYINRVKEHAIADEIDKRFYWENGKGDAVGCTIHSSNHGDYEKELGIPKSLAYLEDRIFENLPDELSKSWPLRFLESIPVGKDLSNIDKKFFIYLLMDKEQCNNYHPICKIVADAYEDEMNGKIIDWYDLKEKAYSAAAAAASTAAYDATYAASAEAAAHSASGAASAYAAAGAAAFAAYAGVDDADYLKLRKEKSYILMSEKLLELLRE